MSAATGPFHFLQGTSVVGPLQYHELQKLVQKGVVSSGTMLSDDSSNWKKAIELVPQLFASKATATPASLSGAERWFVQTNGQQYGPISYTELLGWVNSKSVVAETLIRKSENGVWQRAEDVFPHLQQRQAKSSGVLLNLQATPNSKDGKADSLRKRGGKQSSTYEDSEKEFLAKVGVGTILFIVIGSILLWYFVLEPRIKEAIGPLGWIIWTVVVGYIAHLFQKGNKR